MDDVAFAEEVGARLGCDRRRADDITLVVFRELHDRLTPEEAADVAAQLPVRLRRLWQEEGKRERAVERIHAPEFVGRVRYWTGLADDAMAERAILAVFGALQKLLGSPTGTEGEAGDVLSQLPKDLKRLWLAAAAH